MPEPRTFVVMGVGGSGKSTVAAGLARAIDAEFVEADDFHPPANRAKLDAAVPLTDDDRWPWLDAINAELRSRAARGASVVLACSALKRVYRDRLAAGLPGGLRVIYLHVPRELILERLHARKGHPILKSPDVIDAFVASQFATLEAPTPAEAAVIDVTAEMSIEDVTAAARSAAATPR